MPIGTKAAFEAADGDGVAALLAVVRVTRWQMIARGEVEPIDNEVLPEPYDLARLRDLDVALT